MTRLEAKNKAINSLPVIPKFYVKNQETNCQDNTKDSDETHDSIQN